MNSLVVLDELGVSNLSSVSLAVSTNEVPPPLPPPPPCKPPADTGTVATTMDCKNAAAGLTFTAVTLNGKVNLSNPYYQIGLAVNPKLCLDVTTSRSGSTGGGDDGGKTSTNATWAPCTKAMTSITSQAWIMNEGSGQVSNAAITNAQNSLDIFDQVSSVGILIDLWSFHAGANQVWKRRGSTLYAGLGTNLCLGYHTGCADVYGGAKKGARAENLVAAAAAATDDSVEDGDSAPRAAGNNVAALAAAAAAPAYNSTCWSGKLEGGDLHYTGNMTFPQATIWCKDPKNKCAGFSALASYPSSCTATESLLAIHFKDAWGAQRMDSSKTWTTWLNSNPPPAEYHCEDAKCVPGPARVNYRDKTCLGLCGQQEENKKEGSTQAPHQ